jgi:hypothetical protein
MRVCGARLCTRGARLCTHVAIGAALVHEQGRPHLVLHPAPGSRSPQAAARTAGRSARAACSLPQHAPGARQQRKQPGEHQQRNMALLRCPETVRWLPASPAAARPAACAPRAAGQAWPARVLPAPLAAACPQQPAAAGSAAAGPAAGLPDTVPAGSSTRTGRQTQGGFNTTALEPRVAAGLAHARTPAAQSR